MAGEEATLSIKVIELHPFGWIHYYSIGRLRTLHSVLNCKCHLLGLSLAQLTAIRIPKIV